MFIQRNTKRVGDKVYRSVLLREGYRENGKIKMRTLLNLSSWPKEKIEGLRKVISGEEIFSRQEVEIKNGRSFGCLFALKTIADRLGISLALGQSRRGRLVLFMVLARIINQGSKLAAATWAKGIAKEEVLGLKRFDEDDLYETLDWLDKHQDEIEQALFLKRDNPCDLFLYDVTSTYLEGDKNELAGFGYNRDKKKGKKQIVVGLLTDRDGFPLSCQVFSGQTADPSTFASQIDKARERFGARSVTFVGDKGLIKKVQREHLKKADYFYITSITKAEIECLTREGTIQLSLFDTKVAEVEDGKVRYVLRRNPIRATEAKENRRVRLEKALNILNEEATGLKHSSRRDPNKALRRAIVRVEKLNCSKFIRISLSGHRLTYTLDDKALAKAEALDGCYVIKTDVPKDKLSASEVHDRYKDLVLVEQAFRTMKTGLLEIRPVYHTKATRTKAHVFVTMLAYAITHKLNELTKSLEMAQDQIIVLLDRIQINDVKVGEALIKKVVTPDPDQQKVLDALSVKLPSNPMALPMLTRTAVTTAAK